MLFGRSLVVLALVCCGTGVFTKSTHTMREQEVLKRLQQVLQDEETRLQERDITTSTTDDVTTESRPISTTQEPTITTLYNLDKPAHHTMVEYNRIMDFILKYTADQENHWNTTCGFDMKTLLLGVGDTFEVTTGELEDTFSYLGNYSDIVTTLLDDHYDTALELQEKFETSTSLDPDDIDDHIGLAKDLMLTFGSIAKHEKCLSARLWPILIRLEFYGLQNVTRCDKVMHTLEQHARVYKMNIDAEVCNLDSLMPEISHALREDIFCLSQDITSLGDLSKDLSQFDPDSTKSQSEAVSQAQGAIMMASQIGDDTFLLKGALNTINHMLAKEKTLLNGDGSYKSECDEYRPTSPQSREVSASDIAEMKKLILELKGLGLDK